MHRREILKTTAALGAAQFLPLLARADAAYPQHQIRVLIGTPPGDTVDAWTRVMTAGLAPLLGQPLIVENKVGAHGMIVANYAKAQAKDGYTLMVGTSGPMSINPGVYGDRMTFDPLKDFVAVAPFGTGPLWLYTNNDLPVKNLKDMVAYVKSKPGKVSYGSGGTGTTQHMAMEMLKKATGMEMQHVPYQGSPMVLQGVIGGQIDFAFDAGASLLPQAKSGKVRLIAVSSPKRQAFTADVPTLAEQGLPDFDVRIWAGLFAPTGTPPAILALLNKNVNQVIAGPQFSELLRNTASEPWIGTGEDLHARLASDIQKWTVVAHDANVHAE